MVRYALMTPRLVAVAGLSSEGLARTAEDMVRLSALKARLSLEIETVGGAIDVAVITRNDGFRWVRHKA